MGRPLLLLLALLVALPAVAAAAPPEPKNIRELNEALDALAARLDRIKELAARHEGWRVVESYLGKDDEEFRRQRGTGADDVIDVMVEEGVPEKLRTAARDALLAPKPTSLDPDLMDRKDPRKSRVHFARRHVLKHLGDKDPVVVQHIQDLLLGLFPAARRDTDIRAFNAKTASRTDQRNVERAWRSFLRSQ